MLKDLVDLELPNWQLALAVISCGALVIYIYSSFTSSIPSAQAGLLPGLSNAKAYANYPINFLRASNKKHGSVFKVNMVFNTTYWLLDKQLNRSYLSMKEDIWSFSDGMVRIRAFTCGKTVWTDTKPLGSVSEQIGATWIL